MKNSLVTKTSISVNASPVQVWEALITPKLIKKYLKGTDVSTDWKEGSTITYDGEYEGKKYHDKGIIKKIVPKKTLQSTYLSSMTGKEDRAENYNLVTYKIATHNDKTVITLTQDNNATEKEKEHSTENWKMVIKKMKQVIENKNK
ncbi:SRPBCC family protein [Flavobacterium taihuense]|uniref:SRPBCC domain-containing protein n=1 Tax=Flavobacterium taihuense TaxID=2857508 RepID=A0ABS6XXA9_9FLAO|nr:SRPBCC family protein [Flavobacterium taihuense]MBW4360982.1 SRPBCC domain-containing protein [Flavobacterium taihuense]